MTCCHFLKLFHSCHNMPWVISFPTCTKSGMAPAAAKVAMVLLL